MARYYSYVDSTVGLGNTTVQNMLSNGSEYGVVPSVDIVARNITATGNFIGTLSSSDNVFADLKVTGIATIGIVTGATYYGDGSNLSGVGTFSGDYNDLSNKPTIPTNNNELTNGAGYITNSVTGDFDVSGNVGVGTNSARCKLEISDGTSNTAGEAVNEAYIVGATTGSSEGILTIQSNDAMASNKGGSIAFGGRAISSSTAGANWAFINGYKENGTTANYGGYLSFATRPNSGSISERMRIDSSGRVGVGTTGPNHKLHLNDSGANNVFTQYTNSATGSGLGDGSLIGVTSAGELLIAQKESNAISFHTSNTEKVKIDSSGNVGIGVTDPGSYYGSGNDLVVGGAASHGITIKAGTTGQGIIAFADGTSGGAQQYAGYILYDQTTDHIQFATAATERLRITSDGKVGIGMNVPLATLEVNGDTGVIVHPTSANTTGQIQIAGTRTLGAAAVAIVNLKAIPENPTGNSDAAAFAVETRSGGTGTVTERMRIKSNGWNQSVAVDHVQTNSSAVGAGSQYFFFAGKHSATLGTADSGTTSIVIYTNGNVTNTNNSYGAISDVKLKENIVDANSQWDDIKNLRVRNYNFIEGQTHTQIGVIAQEVETVSPGLVFETPDRNEEGDDLGTVTKSVNYSVLYMKTVKALQEAMERIETLEAKVAALESE